MQNSRLFKQSFGFGLVFLVFCATPAWSAGELKWTYNIGYSVGLTAASIGDDGTIYFGAGRDVYAVSPQGALKWTALSNYDVNLPPVIGNDGTIFVSGMALNPDGSNRDGYGYSSGQAPPSIGQDGRAYVRGHPWGANSIRAYRHYADFVEASAALFEWEYIDVTIDWLTVPVIGSDGTAYFGDEWGFIRAIDTSGDELWTFETGSWVNSPVSIAEDGTIYALSGDNNLYALDKNGQLKWSFPKGSSAPSDPPVISADGTIYVSNPANAYFYALNPDGTQKWRISLKAGGAVIGSDGTIYATGYSLATSKQTVYAINPDGSIEWSFPTEALGLTAPMIGDDGTIYVGSDHGLLYAIASDSSGPENGAWPIGLGQNQRRTNTAAVPTATEVENAFRFENAKLPAGWTTSGNEDWTVSTYQYPADGSYSAQAPLTLQSGQKARMAFTQTTEAGEISFWYAVYEQFEYDDNGLVFYIDGVEQLRMLESVDWTQVSFPISEGSHTFTWEYVMTYRTGGTGNDTAWVDGVEFNVGTAAADTGDTVSTGSTDGGAGGGGSPAPTGIASLSLLGLLRQRRLGFAKLVDTARNLSGR